MVISRTTNGSKITTMASSINDVIHRTKITSMTEIDSNTKTGQLTLSMEDPVTLTFMEASVVIDKFLITSKLSLTSLCYFNTFTTSVKNIVEPSVDNVKICCVAGELIVMRYDYSTANTYSWKFPNVNAMKPSLVGK